MISAPYPDDAGELRDALLSCDVCEHRFAEVTADPGRATCPNCGADAVTVEQERPWGTR